MKGLKLQEMCEVGLCCLIIVVLVVLMFKKENFYMTPNYCQVVEEDGIKNYIYRPDGTPEDIRSGKLVNCDQTGGIDLNGCYPVQQFNYGNDRECTDVSMKDVSGGYGSDGEEIGKKAVSLRTALMKLSEKEKKAVSDALNSVGPTEIVERNP